MGPLAAGAGLAGLASKFMPSGGGGGGSPQPAAQPIPFATPQAGQFQQPDDSFLKKQQANAPLMSNQPAAAANNDLLFGG